MTTPTDSTPWEFPASVGKTTESPYAGTDSKRARVAMHAGRKLRVERGAEWGTLRTFINGQPHGNPYGADGPAMDKAMMQLRRDVKGMDERHALDGGTSAFGPEMYAGAPALTPAQIAWGESARARELADRAALEGPAMVDQADAGTFYVHRTMTDEDYGPREGWHGPLDGRAHADREADAWRSCGWTATVLPDNADTRGQVSAWETRTVMSWKDSTDPSQRARYFEALTAEREAERERADQADASAGSEPDPFRVAYRVTIHEARRHFEQGGAVLVSERGHEPSTVVGPSTVTHTRETTTWDALVEQVREWRGRNPNQRFYTLRAPEINADVEAWNAALATGNPDTIAAARRAVLGSVARQTMDDDPNYAAAGWTTVPAGKPVRTGRVIDGRQSVKRPNVGDRIDTGRYGPAMVARVHGSTGERLTVHTDNGGTEQLERAPSGWWVRLVTDAQPAVGEFVVVAEVRHIDISGEPTKPHVSGW